MPLKSTIPKSETYFSSNQIMLDTCAFTWFAKQDTGIDEFRKVVSKYRVLAPTPVFYELAFGVKEKVHAKEQELLEEILAAKTQGFEMLDFHFAEKINQLPSCGLVMINPSSNEWWTARQRLLKHIEAVNAGVAKVKKDMSLDALIHATARNCFSPICTVNIKDFEKLNTVASQRSHDSAVPLFTPDELVQSLSSDVIYEAQHYTG